jgi:hypothetical protein
MPALVINVKKSMPRSHSICLPVGVSDSAAQGRFFQELSNPDPTELGPKTLLLSHAVLSRSLIFVRPLYDSFAKSDPETYPVERVQLSGRIAHLTDFPWCHDATVSR